MTTARPRCCSRLASTRPPVSTAAPTAWLRALLLRRVHALVRLGLPRNPNHWDKTAPYIEKIERPIITEYATALAQLKAGGIHYYGDGDVDAVRSEDIVSTKKDMPELQMMPTDVTGAQPLLHVRPGPGIALPRRARAPRLDELARP